MGDSEFSFGAGEFKMPVRELMDRDVKQESRRSPGWRHKLGVLVTQGGGNRGTE